MPERIDGAKKPRRSGAVAGVGRRASLGFGLACKQAGDHGIGRGVLEQHGVYGPGDRHVDTVALGQCSHLAGGGYAFGHVAQFGQDGVEMLALCQQQADRPVALASSPASQPWIRVMPQKAVRTSSRKRSARRRSWPVRGRESRGMDLFPDNGGTQGQAGGRAGLGPPEAGQTESQPQGQKAAPEPLTGRSVHVKWVASAW